MMTPVDHWSGVLLLSSLDRTRSPICRLGDVFCHLLTLSNPIFLPTAYSPALIYCGRERGWWITCWLKSVLHEEKCRTGSYSGAGEQTQKKSVGQAPTAERANKRTKKKCRTSPDIGAEWENHNVRRGPT
jgi:hypothetical protein